MDATRSRIFLIMAAIAATVLPKFGMAENTPADRPALKVGDKWKVERYDGYTKKLLFAEETVVTAISPANIDIAVNGSPGKMTPDLTGLDSPRMASDPGYQLLRFPLEVGKKWDFKTQWLNKQNGVKGGAQLDVEVKAMESVKVPAGEFEAYRLEASGYLNTVTGRNWSATATYWYAPKAKSIVRFVWTDKNNDYVSELVKLDLAQ